MASNGAARELTKAEIGPLLGRGRTAEVRQITEARVVKLFRENWSPDRAAYEERVSATVHRGGVPSPASFGIVQHDGRIGIEFERVDGPSLMHTFALKPWTLLRLVRLFTELHIEVHAKRVPELPSPQAELRGLINRSPHVPDHFKARAALALSRLPDGDHLSHGDYHPDNVVVTANGPVIIDWLTATRGDPAADVANTSLLLKLGALPPLGISRFMMQAARGIVHSRYLRRYKKATGLTQEQVDRWLLPIATTRLAMGIQQERTELLRIIDRVEDW